MCRFFSCVVSKNGQIYFCEGDSHEDVLSYMKKAGISTADNERNQNIVRLELFRADRAKVDESTIPEWFERNAAKFKAEAIKLRRKVIVQRRKLAKNTSEDNWNFSIDFNRDKGDFEDLGWNTPYIQKYLKAMSKIKGYIGRKPGIKKKNKKKK